MPSAPRIASRLLAFLVFSTLVCAQPRKDRTVVLISLDGFPAFALEDPKLPVPTLRKLIREGAFAPRMRGTNPTVTWAAHTTMVTGVTPSKHHVIYNGLLVRQGPDRTGKVEPWRNQPEWVKAPTVYDVAYNSGLTTAEVDWVAIYAAPTITWAFPEIPSVDGKVEKEMIAAGLVAPADISSFRAGIITWRDFIWTEAAAFILGTHKPNLLLYHPLNLDSTHHRYGPRSLASYNAMEYADKQVARLVEAARDAGMLDRTTFLVVADHGFRTVKKTINLSVVLRDAWSMPEGGTAMVFLKDPAKHAEVKESLRSIEGVARIYEPAEFHDLGLPTPAESDQAPDLLLAAKPDYTFGGAATGAVVTDVPAGSTPGSHGYLASDPDMETFLIAWGAGIRPGVRLGPVSSLDIAPTIAGLLGLAMPGTTGKPLAGLLK